MESYSGILHKMKSQWASPIHYALYLSEYEIPLNAQLNHTLRMEFTGQMYCIQCSRKTTKSFQQGYCYPCYRRLLECNLCIIHPERCLVETGSCSTHDWSHAQCHQTHIVYLANASGLKIGITRESQIPTRWIDQGAIQALPIIKVKNRYRAGIVEVAFKKFVRDKTNWRMMLKNEVTPLDLLSLRNELLSKAESQLKKIEEELQETLEFVNAEPITLSYPVIEYPQKIHTLSFDQSNIIEGTLLGIKGQYLLLDQGVINVRKFSGYEIKVDL